MRWWYQPEVSRGHSILRLAGEGLNVRIREALYNVLWMAGDDNGNTLANYLSDDRRHPKVKDKRVEPAGEMVQRSPLREKRKVVCWNR